MKKKNKSSNISKNNPQYFLIALAIITFIAVVALSPISKYCCKFKVIVDTAGITFDFETTQASTPSDQR